VVASHRVARQLQRAGELLVAPVARLHGFADERADARTHDCARSAARATPRLGGAVSSLRIRRRCANVGPHSAGCAALTRPARRSRDSRAARTNTAEAES